jgi:hypothetical protein
LVFLKCNVEIDPYSFLVSLPSVVLTHLTRSFLAVSVPI